MPLVFEVANSVYTFIQINTSPDGAAAAGVRSSLSSVIRGGVVPSLSLTWEGNRTRAIDRPMSV